MSRPLVIAHRGSSGTRPENTFAAFEQAIEDQADMIETDLHMSRDREVMIHHDAALGRLGKEAQIRDLSVEELRELDAAPGHDETAQMPRLIELLDRFAGRIPFNLELKVAADDAHYEGLEALVVSEVEERDLLPRVLFSSFYDPVLARVRDRCPEARIALLFSPRANFKILERAERVRAEAINPDVRLVTPELVASAHAVGLRVYPYTANDSAEMARLLDCGVDGVITNFPPRLRALLDTRESA